MKLCDRSLCSGCSACMAVCPANAITMQPDDRGFLYPAVDEKICLSCGMCDKLTENLKNHMTCQPHSKEPKATYAVIHQDENRRMASQSGGLFFALAETVLESGGVVYGCGYVDNVHAAHIRAENIEGIEKMRGSKYVQSDMGDCMKSVAADLKSGKTVMFSGTPCQVAGIEALIKTLNIKRDKFFSCDLVCHGVPSPKILEQYLQVIQHKYKSNITRVNLRCKELGGWHVPVEKIEFENGKAYEAKTYADLYYSNLCFRKSCESCQYAKLNRPGDITMADCLGIEKCRPDLWNDNKGISLALIQTEAGTELFEKSNEKLRCEKLMENECIQPQLKRPHDVPKEKEKFWNDYKHMSFERLMKKYTIYGGIRFKVKRKLKKFLRYKEGQKKK